MTTPCSIENMVQSSMVTSSGRGVAARTAEFDIHDKQHDEKEKQRSKNKSDSSDKSLQMDEKRKCETKSLNRASSSSSSSDKQLDSDNSFLLAVNNAHAAKRSIEDSDHGDERTQETKKYDFPTEKLYITNRNFDRSARFNTNGNAAGATAASATTTTMMENCEGKQKVSTKTETSDFLEKKIRIANRSENHRHRNNQRNHEQKISLNDAVNDFGSDQEDSKEEEKEEVRPGAVSVPGMGFDGPHYESNNNLDAPNLVDVDEDMTAPVAMVVDSEELEREFRATMMINTVKASVVDNMDETNSNKTRRCITVAAGIVVVVVLVVSLSVGLKRDRISTIETAILPSLFPTMLPSLAPSAVPTTTPLPTLETIKNYGAVRCGTGPVVPETLFIQEMSVDICRALAAAIFGDPDRHEVYPYEPSQAFLVNKTLDVVSLFTEFEMDDVLKPPGEVGFTFTDPVFFDGLSFGGISPYVECADRLDGFFGECRNLRICVDNATAGGQVVSEWFPSSKIRRVPLPLKNLVDKLNSGECNVIGGPRSLISPWIVFSYGYSDEYTVGNNIISKTFYSFQTRDDDHQWSDFVNWIFRALIAAEHRGITKESADKFMKTSVFGKEFENMFSNAIAAIGNYGEFFAKHSRGLVPREAFNEVNTGNTGLISSFPLGQRTHKIGPDPVQGSVMDIIVKRGILRCGITSKMHADVWKGMDEDYCRALSASLFEGNGTKVEFVEMDTVENGFVGLDRNEVDILAGVRATLEADVLEPTTGKGYTFSMPYFHGPLDNDSFGSKSIALVTREDDSQWSSFVFWIVSATILAEENGTTQQYGNEMPTVNLFGLSFKDMFRRAVSAIGNYDEIYHRSPFIPQRSGQNMLNLNLLGPQLYDRF